MRTIAFAAALVLTACATAPPPPPPVITAVKQVCQPVTPWTDAQQDQMRKEYDALAPSTILRSVFRDYIAMRDAARACAASQK